MRLISLVAGFLPFLATTIANPTAPRAGNYRHTSVQVVHEFPFGTWLQNLAVRANGQILATVLSTPDLVLVDPLRIDQPLQIASFPSVSGLLGIAEAEQDIFYVLGGDYSVQTNKATPGSYAVWRVDLNNFQYESNTGAQISKFIDLPEAAVLNGLTSLDREAGTFLIADSGLGLIYRLNTHTKELETVVDDVLLKNVPGATNAAIGVNGLNVYSDVLYFTNTAQNILGQISINADGTPRGKAQIVANINTPNDFAISQNGDFLITQEGPNQLNFLPRGGAGSVTVLVNSNDVAGLVGTTAARFGRGRSDRQSLYVTSNGGAQGYASGNFKVGGRVSRVDYGA